MTTALLFPMWLSFLFSLFTFSISKADTLLIPDKTVSFEEYQTKCRLDGYQCTFDYFRNQHLQEPTPKFNAFIDSVDTTSKHFNDSSAKTVRTILENESISLEQLEMLIRVLEQTELPLNKALIKEMQFVKSLLEAEPKTVNQADYYMVFKRPVSKSSLTNLTKSYLNILVTKIVYNQSVEHLRLRSTTGEKNLLLVEGECENAKAPTLTDVANWKVFSNNSCSWSQGMKPAVTSLYKSVHKNRNWFYTGALILGSVIIASKYEVQVSF